MTGYIAGIFQSAGLASIAGLADLQTRLQAQASGANPAVLDVYAEYCGFSKAMAQPFADLAQENAGQVDFWGVDAVQNAEVSSEYRVSGLPSFIGFACGSAQGTVAGADQEALNALIGKLKTVQC